MEMLSSEVMRQAKEMLDKGENLDLASSYFNRLYNATLDGKNDADVYLFYLACVNMKQNNDAMSILLFNQAVERNPGFVEAINNLGYVYKKVGKFEDARKCFEKVILLVGDKDTHIPPEDRADYLTNLGSLKIGNGTPYEAIDFFTRAEAISDKNPQNKWNRSLAYLELGEYEKGFSEYEFGDRNLKGIERSYGVENLPFWDGTPGQNIVVYGEQGIGDEIMFASMLPDIMKNNNVIIDAHPRLADFFRLNFPKTPVYGTRKETSKDMAWPKYHKVDSKIAIGSLAKYYRVKEEEFPKTPYLIACPDRVKKYADILNEMPARPKIGFSWKGGTVSTGMENRIIPLHLFKEIFKLDADFISLQYHKDVEKEIKLFEIDNDIKLNHWQTTLNDYDETAALVANLDLIISVPQSVVHLAGALGTPTWQLTPFRSLWQMGTYGKNMPWYGCVKNFWQEPDCKWEKMMIIVKDELCSLLQKNIAS